MPDLWTLAAVHAAATLLMTGLIWFVQLVHYPLFPAVGADAFVTYEHQHTRRVTSLVATWMGIEAVTAAALFAVPLPGTGGPLALVGLLLLVAIWGSTAWLQMPCHRRLCDGFDAATAARLVRTNWIRTVAWSARGAVAILLLRELPHSTPG